MKRLLVSTAFFLLACAVSSVALAAPQTGQPQGNAPNAGAAPAASNIEILWPRTGAVFTARLITVTVRCADPVQELRISVEDGTGTAVSEERLPLPPGVTRSVLVGLAEGRNRIVAADASTGEGSDPIEVTLQEPSKHDDRATFEATFYAGVGIDTFAANDLARYLNPGASGGTRERFVAGFDFAYRLFGAPDDPKKHQLWLYGETVHGVRSTDVDCKANPNLPVCKPFDIESAGTRTLYILRNATSLEAFAGLRWEFLALNPNDTESPARVYFKTQFGFLTVADGPDDAVDIHQFAAVGLTATRGAYKGSYFEIGYGKTDLFLERRNRRFKVDGFLTWHPTWFKEAGIAPFAQMTVDSDLGRGSDSIQTYIGFDFDLKHLFSWGRK